MSTSRTDKTGAPSGALFTSRLVLRRARSEDAAAFWPILSDPAAMRYWSTPPHADPQETQDWVDRMTLVETDFVIERDGIAIGKAGVYRAPDTGFILHPAHWRQGIIKEAMQAILPHIWATTDLTHLTADVDPRNAASIATLKSLGFRATHTAERTFFISGEWCDSVYFRRDRPEV